MRIFLFGILLAAPAQAAYEPCGVEMRRLGTYEARPGQAFQMYGRWGRVQGKKIPAINNGPDSGVLEVLSWRDEELIVKVPLNLKSGDYKVGVYCNPLGPPYNGSYSSGWVDFRVVGGAEGGEYEPSARSVPKRGIFDWVKFFVPWAAFSAIMLLGVMRQMRKRKDNLPRPLN